MTLVCTRLTSTLKFQREHREPGRQIMTQHYNSIMMSTQSYTAGFDGQLLPLMATVATGTQPSHPARAYSEDHSTLLIDVQSSTTAHVQLQPVSTAYAAQASTTQSFHWQLPTTQTAATPKAGTQHPHLPPVPAYTVGVHTQPPCLQQLLTQSTSVQAGLVHSIDC